MVASATREPIVFLPGLNCTAELFAPQFAAFGDGRSILVAEHRLDDTLGGIVQRLLASAPPRFAVCGLSMGGHIAFELMRLAPERVTRLALLDTSAKGPTPETDAVRLRLIALCEKGRFDTVCNELWQRLVAPSRLGDAGLRAIADRMAEACGPEVFIRQQQAIMKRPDSRPGLTAIKAPVLVLAGELDVITPPDHSVEIAGLIGSNATLKLLEGCGHLSTLEAPEEVNKALSEWLSTA
ncbi:MAG: alpha/beta fold hydrolase [Bosea sp. (in: a-proteobacteria)]